MATFILIVIVAGWLMSCSKKSAPQPIVHAPQRPSFMGNVATKLVVTGIAHALGAKMHRHHD
jgi:hypothetical protein